MRIKKIFLKNGYKRFKQLTIDLGENPARIIALVGPNGCGKSSVLDGLLFHHNTHSRLGDTVGRNSSYHSMDDLPVYNHTNVDIEFATGTYSQIRNDLDATGKGTTMFSFRSPYRYNSELKVREIRANSEIRLNNYGASDASSLDGKMENNYRRLLGIVNKFMEENDVKPSEARIKIIGDLNKSIRKCLDLEISSVGNVEGAQGTLYFKKANHPKEFEFNVLSSGEKEVVDILLDLYLRKNDYDNSVFLIDEPELHISTSIQGKLLIEINRLVGENCQIWLTTHSMGFLRALQTKLKDVCQIIEFRDEYELASKPFVLRPMKATAQAWRELFAVALDDLATLVSPRVRTHSQNMTTAARAQADMKMSAHLS